MSRRISDFVYCQDVSPFAPALIPVYSHCWWLFICSLPALAPGSPSPPWAISSWPGAGGRARGCTFHLCLPTAGPCPAHRVDTEALPPLVASPSPTSYVCSIASSFCKTDGTHPLGCIFPLMSRDCADVPHLFSLNVALIFTSSPLLLLAILSHNIMVFRV